MNSYSRQLISGNVEKASELVKSIFSVPLRSLVLYLIALNGEMHGYEIMKKISELTLNLWKPSPSTLYLVLDNLVKEGLLERSIEYRGKLKRIKYRITSKGIEILRISSDLSLRVMYQIIELLELLNKKIKKLKSGENVLDKSDLEKQIELLENIRNAIDEKIEQLKNKLSER